MFWRILIWFPSHLVSIIAIYSVYSVIAKLVVILKDNQRFRCDSGYVLTVFTLVINVLIIKQIRELKISLSLYYLAYGLFTWRRVVLRSAISVHLPTPVPSLLLSSVDITILSFSLLLNLLHTRINYVCPVCPDVSLFGLESFSFIFL